MLLIMMSVFLVSGLCCDAAVRDQLSAAEEQTMSVFESFSGPDPVLNPGGVGARCSVISTPISVKVSKTIPNRAVVDEVCSMTREELFRDNFLKDVPCKLKPEYDRFRTCRPVRLLQLVALAKAPKRKADGQLNPEVGRAKLSKPSDFNTPKMPQSMGLDGIGMSKGHAVQESVGTPDTSHNQ